MIMRAGMSAALAIQGGAIALMFVTSVGEKPLVSLAALLVCAALFTA